MQRPQTQQRPGEHKAFACDGLAAPSPETGEPLRESGLIPTVPEEFTPSGVNRLPSASECSPVSRLDSCRVRTPFNVITSTNPRVNGHRPGRPSEAPLRTVPHNLEAEQALLGAILVNNEAYRRVADSVRPRDFFDQLHASIYESASVLIDAGQRADPITLRPFFENAEPVRSGVTVTAYLGQLAANATTIVNVRHYARTICDLSTRRRLIVIAEDMQKAAYDTPVDFPPNQQIAELQQRLRVLDNDGDRLTAVSAANFAGQPVPAREWHAKDLIPEKNVTLLTGDGGTGKSLLAAQLSVATELGRPWLGCDVKRGPVIYFGAEDDLEEMHRRFAAIASEEGINLDRLESLHICCLAGKNAVLATANDRGIIQPTDLWAALRSLVISIKPKLVVFDTLADLFGGNENVRTQAQQFVSMLRGLALETDSTALLLAHPSVSGIASGSGTSGSTAWSNSVRSRLYLDHVRENGVEADPDARVLRTMKSNYGPKGGEIRLRWFQGVFTTGDANGAEAAALSARQMHAEVLFLDLLTTYTDQGRPIGPVPGTIYAPALFAREPKAKGVGKRELENAMGRLLEAGRIRVTERGPPSRLRRYLEVAS
jgi:RecA-family ATPase